MNPIYKSLIISCLRIVSAAFCRVRRLGARLFAFALLGLLGLCFGLCGCSITPKLSAEDRKQDIEFLADWARDYSPFVALNEKHKGVPSCQALKARYLRFAEEAETNEEFYRVVIDYFSVIGASGHAYLVSEDMAKWLAVGILLGMSDVGISARQMWAGAYWSRLSYGIPWRAHPPFRVAGKDGGYFTDDDWQCQGIAVPRGSRILSVDGLTGGAYLDYIKTRTHLRYDAFPKDWADQYLLIIDEGTAFRGWHVEFLLPDGRTVDAFVPKMAGLPAKKGEVSSVDAEDNCTCIELSASVGYIRVKTMGNLLGHVFKGPMKRERNQIRAFLEHSQGRYQKLIIDVRNNGGGWTEHAYENLAAPFLDKPLTFKRTVGVKRKYLQDTKPSVLRCLGKEFGQYIVGQREVPAPNGFAPGEWVFYELTLRVRPSARYNFHGKLYVLVNGGCFSATDDYADLVKRTRLGTLVGERTGGSGVTCLSTPEIRLPRSGMLFRVQTTFGLTPNGQVNELVGTEPDVRLPSAGPPKSITREGLLQHPWIQKVMTEL